MKLLCWIWLIFSLLFVVMTVCSFVQAGNRIHKFEPPRRPGSGQGSVTILGMDIDQPFNEFVKNFNEYLEGYNKSTRSQNLIAAFGYLAATLISLVSFSMSKGWIK